MSWLLEGRSLDSILITRLRYLGDVVMATPLLEVLRQGDPQIRLGFLAEGQHGQILQGHPHLEQLHLLSLHRQGSDAKARAGAAGYSGAVGAGSMVRELINSQYDLAVDLFFNPRSAWLLRMSGIRHRIGGTRGSRHWLYSHTVIPSDEESRYSNLFQVAPGGLGEHLARLAPLVHKESNLSFLDWFDEQYKGRVLAPHLPREYWAAKNDLSCLEGVEGFIKPPIVLAPGATWQTKEWPLKHWEKLIQGIVETTDRPLLVLQPPSDNKVWFDLGRLIPSGRGQVLPVLNLPQVLELLSNSALLVSVDGGIMHAGVGLGVPTLGLFGPTDPTLWFPYEMAGPYRVLTSEAHCAPCHRHVCDDFLCLPDILPSRVLEQCYKLLGNGGQ